MNQRKTEANRNWRKTFRRTFIRCTENDDKKHSGHYNFSHQTSTEGISTWRMRTISIGRQSTR